MKTSLRLLPSFLATILFAGVVAQAASCTLDQQGTGEKPKVTFPCSEDANCRVTLPGQDGPDDKDSCTLNVCGPTGICEFPIVPGIAPEQTPGDCQRTNCTASGEKSDEPDDEDLPDDLESCTIDSCLNGTKVHEKLPDGTSCTRGEAAGLCESGECKIECGPSFPECNDDNPCTEDSCNANTGKCTFVNLDGLPTPDAIPVAGDCKQQICINGKNTAIADDADVLNDGDSCTTNGCQDGVPVIAPTNAAAPCTGPNNSSGVCNEMGLKCVECFAAIHCPVIMNPCQERACENNACVVKDLAGDIPSKVGDCRKTVCTNGFPAESIDNTDVLVDGNPCTNDVCTNGNPSNPNTMAGANCGGTLMCNGMGQCTGCTTNAACGTDNECTTYTCANPGPMGQCNIAYFSAGMALPPAQQTPGDCKVRQCDGKGNLLIVVSMADFPQDNKECTVDSCDAMGNPSNTPKMLNEVCTEKGGAVCDGLGNCLKAGGADCTDATQCLTGYCTDGVCCDGTCTDQCMACNVANSLGVCANVMVGGDDAPLCTGTNSCDGAGACKRDNGQPCGAAADCSSGVCVDGVCCNTACDDTCKSCNLTGSVGVCSFVKNDVVDPTGPMPCNNPYRCDGAGVCKALNGVTCAVGTECLSNYCVDGFCCNNVCNLTCFSCSAALGTLGNGTCSFTKNGTDPDNECNGLNPTCSGLGTCNL